MNLAQRQEQLLASLVAGGPTPAGFSERHLAATRAALLAKRAAEVNRWWPALAAAHGAKWQQVFAEWARSRPPQGSLRDGWDFALDHPPQGPALVELRVRQALWVRPRKGPLRLRRLPALRICAEAGRRRIILQLAGKVYFLR